MPNILITGFEPFGGQPVNPSWQAVQGVHAPAGVTLTKAELPVCWGQTAYRLAGLIERHHPDRILLTGQAGGSDRVRVERVGINLRDCASADNAGVILRDRPIFEGAPAAYFTTYDHAAILSALSQASIPAGLSYSAGAYLCNEALYTALHLLPSAKTGFIHLPYLPEQSDNCFTLPLDRQILALQLALEVIAAEK